MNDSQKNLLDRVREAKKKEIVKKEEIDNRPDSELTLNELAARELIRGKFSLHKKKINQKQIINIRNFAV